MTDQFMEPSKMTLHRFRNSARVEARDDAVELPIIYKFEKLNSSLETEDDGDYRYSSRHGYVIQPDPPICNPTVRSS
jgi:hypothetical protein